ncbi:MAG: zinc ribbon domain-containing protein [Sulfuricella denitrificans]|nr:zinc ribbon domain-containing protein [Sulfuricella denitrificans]
MEVIIVWFVLSVVSGIIASNKGRSGFGFFILALLLSPLIGIIMALVVKSHVSSDGQPAPSANTHVKCPDCKELILKDARVCKHCGCKLTGEQLEGNSQKRCTKCGSMNGNTKAVCISCGSVI